MANWTLSKRGGPFKFSLLIDGFFLEKWKRDILLEMLDNRKFKYIEKCPPILGAQILNSTSF